MKKLLFILSILVVFSSVRAQIQIGQDILGAQFDDQVGYSVSASANGSRIAIGAWHSYTYAYTAGYIKIFEENNGSWVQVGQTIQGFLNDHFGASVSISADGKRLIISSFVDYSNNGRGYVKVYEEISGVWTQIGQDINGEMAGDEFGFSVSISANGQRIAIGAPGNDGNGTNAGHIKIFEEVNGNWGQIGQTIEGEAAEDELGFSISLSFDGKRVGVGAPGNDGNGAEAGHARIYEETNNSWAQIGQDIDGEAAGDSGDFFSTFSVALSSDGTRIAIGAPWNAGNGTKSGHVRIFEENSGLWTQIGQDIDGAQNDKLGVCVSISENGKRLAIGNNPSSSLSEVKVFDEINGNWMQLGQSIIEDVDGDSFGSIDGTISLSKDGNTVVIGAPKSDEIDLNSGKAKAYALMPLTNQEEIYHSQLSLAPNPTDGQFYIDLKEEYKQTTITLTDVAGRVIARKDYEDVLGIPMKIEGGAGIYLVKVSIDSGISEVFKVVKY